MATCSPRPSPSDQELRATENALYVRNLLAQKGWTKMIEHTASQLVSRAVYAVQSHDGWDRSMAEVMAEIHECP